MLGRIGSAIGAAIGAAIALGATSDPVDSDLSLKSVKQGKSRRRLPYVDRAGLSHGRTGDKLARKAAHGTIGLRNRGPYAAWHLTKR